MRVTVEDKIKFNELYLKLKSYAAVARETGFSPTTVKKYIDPNYTPAAIDEKKVFDRPLPDFDPSPFMRKDWGPLCVLSDEEKLEIQELWKELSA